MPARPILNPAGRSPYQRYGKTRYVYPGWVTERRPPPADIARELRIAVRDVALAIEELRRAQRKKQHHAAPRTPRAAAAE